MVDLAIVIVSYNVCDLLRRCLTSVLSASGDLTLSVCVVDNNSADDSVAMVSAEFPQVKLIANLVNVGYPAGNNQGLKLLGVDNSDPIKRPRYCLLLNPDTEVPPHAFCELISFMQENPEIGVIGPKLVLLDGRLDLACRRSFPTPEIALYRFSGLSKLFPKSPRFGRYNMTFKDEDEVTEVDSVVGAFMLVRTEAISEVGLMDERFWMYGEDIDWAKRIKGAGWRILYYPKVTVLHVKRASSRQSQRAQFEFYRAMLIFYYKHYHQVTSLPMHWLVMFGLALKGGRPIIKEIGRGDKILDN